MSHYEDEAQVEQLRRWWRENWMALAGGLALGLVGIFGWQKWQDMRTAKSEHASQMYEDLKKLSADKMQEGDQLGQKLIEEFATTPYAAQACLLLASRAAEAGNWDAARSRLDWVLNKSDDPGLKKIARLRLARVLWQQGKPDDALAQLNIPDEDAFASLYQELRGDIQLGKGDKAAARGAYDKALLLGPAGAARDELQRKIDNLAGATS